MPVLRAFARTLECVLVVTQPARPAGRGQRLMPATVELAARELGLEVYTPERLRDGLVRLADAGADLFAVASYGKIVPQSILDLPRLGALNVHPSLLPLYRGATPLQSQLRDGVRESGVSVIWMDAGMDTGDLVLQERSAIGSHETYGELHERFAHLGADLLARATRQTLAGTLERIPQAHLADEARVAATLTRPLTKADLEVDWNWPAARIANHVRSLAPSPAARAELAGERVKLLSVTPGRDALFERSLPAGTLLGPRGSAALVRCGDGVVAVERLIPPNRAAVEGARFVQMQLRA